VKGGSPALRVVGLRKEFGGKRAVDGIDLEVAAGEYLCVLGPSGSGKSTLLRLIAGFDRPDAGEVHLGGTRVDALPPEARPVHTVFQGYALFPHLTVARNVAFGLEMRGVPAAEVRDRVEDALALVGLPGFGPRRPQGLSGGEQQRVALARALVNRPPLLLLDEPLAALDRKLRLRMQDELLRIQRDLGVAFLHVTHDQEEALRLADRIALMDGGRVLQAGDPGEVYRRPASAFAADFLGSANVLTAEWATVVWGSQRKGSGVPPVGGGEGGWALRPEAIRLFPAAGAGAEAPDVEGVGGALRMDGVVEGYTLLGGMEEVRVRCGDALLRIHRLAGRTGGRLPTGAAVVLELDPEDLVPLPAP